MAGYDKRDQCGCHRACSIFSHDCPNPCRWPNCLTDAEQDELMREVERQILDRHNPYAVPMAGVVDAWVVRCIECDLMEEFATQDEANARRDDHKATGL